MKPTLSPKDDALVRKARAHWARMRDDLEGCKENTRAEDCALCGEYFSIENGNCTKCPVMLITGEESCQGTPYVGTSILHTRARSYTDRGTPERRLAVLAFKLAAQLVIDWIDENLLPAGDEVFIECLVDRATGIRRMVDKRLFTEAELARMRKEYSRPLSLEQQLPSEVTRAAEGEEGS